MHYINTSIWCVSVLAKGKGSGATDQTCLPKYTRYVIPSIYCLEKTHILYMFRKIVLTLESELVLQTLHRFEQMQSSVGTAQRDGRPRGIPSYRRWRADILGTVAGSTTHGLVPSFFFAYLISSVVETCLSTFMLTPVETRLSWFCPNHFYISSLCISIGISCCICLYVYL